MEKQNLQITPTLLTDKSRLQEIYDLRVTAYEQSDYKEFINFNLYPDGWSDFLDDNSYHWIIEDDNKIVASARLTIINHFSDIIKLGNEIPETVVPKDRPFCLFSRLVVLNDFRGLGISRLLDQTRISKFIETNMTFALAKCRDDRFHSLIEQGFIKLCNYTDKENPKPEILNLLIIHPNNIKK